jgi:hypothetical protein
VSVHRDEFSPHEQADLDLADFMSEFYADPYGHVMASYPWGEGQLDGRTGPDVWQKGFLIELGEEVAKRGFDGINAVDPIQFCTSSGHGIGKSCMTSWLVGWILSTRPMSKGIVTANTAEQLRTKTWAEVAKWYNMSLTKHWFTLNAGGGGSMNMYHKVHKEAWRCDAQTAVHHNSEAFAGLHAANSTPFYVFDEAGGIPTKIFEVREGGLTDGEPMTFDWGNPTRATGRFHQQMMGKLRHRYITRTIDSRDVAITNKDVLSRWIDDYGIDSDFVKVRVLGQFPSLGSRQYISTEDVNAATARHLRKEQYAFAPVIIGVDPAWTGEDEFVIYLRQGLYSKLLAKYSRNDNDVAMAQMVAQFQDDYNADAVFVDGGFGTGIVSIGESMGRDWQIIWFSGQSGNPGCHNKRAEMWTSMRDWIKKGGAIEDDPVLHQDLTGPELVPRLDGKILLESKDHMKERDLASPNRGDALALTFAFPVASRTIEPRPHERHTTVHDYEPL